ncbi:MAG: hypothetical protein DWQ07_04780 [Chloroflexi bacterium]|nr:MAG: hypothetical protein DWQ07_04780 [Chloroflexota bacterium]MBL1194746.1 hypothetical protein [Chloroflexota bacterium]NOH12038.1 hypothetical protein [Chloroflexota bacterium]
MKHYRLVATIFILALLVGACNLPGGGTISEADAVRFAQETLQAQLDAGEVQPQEQAQAPEDQAPADQPPAGDTAPPTETPIPATLTITLTPTSAVPMVSVSTATNCRTGPGVPYAITGALSPGQNGIVAAQSSVNNYVLIQNPSGGANCWLWLQHATITGDISGLPVVTPPPSPTPTFTPTPMIDWSGSWMLDNDNGFGSYPLVITQTGNSISAVATAAGETATITGTVSADGRTVTATWSNTLGESGTLTWQLVPGTVDQFTGNAQITVPGPGSQASCGFRNGAGKPNPCLGP